MVHLTAVALPHCWGASLVAQSVKNLPVIWPRFNPWVGKIPWRRKWQPTPAFLPGKSHRQRSLVGCSPWDHKELGVLECIPSVVFPLLFFILKTKENKNPKKVNQPTEQNKTIVALSLERTSYASL